MLDQYTLSASFLRKKLKSGAQKAELKEIRLHDLRHSYATNLIELGHEYGIDHMAISKSLGHHNTRQMYLTYGHITDAQNNKIANALNNLYR